VLICAPILGALCKSKDKEEAPTILTTDVEPEIFRYLLEYMYGWSVPEEAPKNTPNIY
jgi:hypothetical protein